MLARQGRDTVQRLPLGWVRPWVLIHDGAFTIALASKEDAAIFFFFLLHIKVSGSTACFGSASLCCDSANRQNITHFLTAIFSFQSFIVAFSTHCHQLPFEFKVSSWRA